MHPVRFGVDLLLEEGAAPSLRIGLVTNRAATTSLASSVPLQPSFAALHRSGFPLSALFSPEHGLDNDAEAGMSVEDQRDGQTGLPVYSLYGKEQTVPDGLLDAIDVLLFDLPDVGSRFYTYIWTLSYVMESCASSGTALWVLDRPNPLSGSLLHVEGPILNEDQMSTFVGRWSMPVRHSLTVGELARLWKQERFPHLELRVLPLQGWRRAMSWPDTDNPFVPTSPAIADYETALLYAGTCLFEGTNLSEGRGTAAPFRQIGAPWVDETELEATLSTLRLDEVRFRAASFVPYIGKYAGKQCRGVMIHPIDGERFRPVRTGLTLLATIIQLYPHHFGWYGQGESAAHAKVLHFDRLIGRTDIRSQLETSPEQALDRIDEWTAVEGWQERVEAILLY